MSTCEHERSGRNSSRVCGAQIDTDGFTRSRHYSTVDFGGWRGGVRKTEVEARFDNLVLLFIHKVARLNRACISHEEAFGRRWNLREDSKKT